MPLLVMAGHLTGEDARARLKAFFHKGLEFEDQWTYVYGEESLRAARATLEGSVGNRR